MALKIASLFLALAVIITNGQVNCPGGIADDDGFCIHEKKGAVFEDETNSGIGELRSGTLGQEDDQKYNVTDATTVRLSNSLSSLREGLAKALSDSSENLVLANNEKSQLDSGSFTSDEKSPSDVAHISDEFSHSFGTQDKHDDSLTAAISVEPNFGYSGREQDMFGKEHSSVINGWALGDHTGENDRSLGSLDNYSPDGPRSPRGFYLAPYNVPELRKSGGPSLSPFSGASPSRSGSLQGSYDGFSPDPSGGLSLGYFTGPSPSPSGDTGPSPFGGPSVDTTGGQSLGPSDGPSLFPLTGPTPRSFGDTKDSNGGPSRASSSSSSDGPSVDSAGGPLTGVGIGCFDGSSGGPDLGYFGGPIQVPGIGSPVDPRRGPPGGSFTGPSIGSWGGRDPYVVPPAGGPGLGSWGPGISGPGSYPNDYLRSPGYGIGWQGAPGYLYNYLSGPGYGFAWQWGPGYSYNYISGPGYGFVWQWSPGFSYNHISTPGYGISDQGPGYHYSHNSGPAGNSITEKRGPGYPYNQLTNPGSSFVGQMGSGYPQKVSNSPGHNLEAPGYQHIRIYPRVDGYNSQIKSDVPNDQTSGFEPQGPVIDDDKVSPKVTSTTLPPQ